MSTVTHQTIRLSRGKHSAPEDGACVMELASMLAGESFTDHPQTVCPTIASFMRAYNDSVDDARRQDLYAFASSLVGSRASAEVERARTERLIEWAAEQRPHRWERLLPAPIAASLARRRSPTDTAGTHAVHAIRGHDASTHAAVLELIDELLAIGSEPAGPASPPRRAKRSLAFR
jgi:hypothetical protein